MAALLHFLIEVVMFKTMSLKAAANPMIIAGKWPPYDLNCEVRLWCLRPVDGTFLNLTRACV